MDRIAKFVFNELLISNPKDDYRFTEIEFYILSDVHPDRFSHEADMQKQFGMWYFHPSGIDITFGEGVIYASFLIRGVGRMGPGGEMSFTSGPLNVLDELLNSGQKVDAKYLSLSLKYKKGLKPIKWIQHQRIGLNKNSEIKKRKLNEESNSDELFFDKPYRYVAWLKPEHQFKDKTKVLQDAFITGEDRDLIEQAFSYKPSFLK